MSPPLFLLPGILRPGPWSIADVWDQTAPRHGSSLGWAILLSHLGALSSAGTSWPSVRCPWLHRPANPCLGLPGRPRLLRARCRPDRCAVAQRLGLSSRLHGASADLYALGCPLRRYLCQVLLARRPASTAARKGRTGPGLLLGSDRPPLFTLLSAHCCCPSSASFICCSSRKVGVGGSPVLLFGLATLVAALQLPLLPRGVAYTEGEDLGSRFTGGARSLFSHYPESHDKWPCRTIRPPAGEHLLLALPLLVLMVAYPVAQDVQGLIPRPSGCLSLPLPPCSLPGDCTSTRRS